MPVARSDSSGARVIAHIDMDCFYVQVEQRRQPSLRGHPTAVVQYNSWKGGGLIAIGYEARKYGVKRSMRGEEAKKLCPDIQLVQVPVARGKADLTVYRSAGSEVVSILSKAGRCERASIDEVYLDLTEASEKMLAEHPPERLPLVTDEALKSHVLGLHLDGANPADSVKKWIVSCDAHHDKLLACGARIVAELRLEVLRATEFTCSAGIAHNKMLAKLASGMNKPAQQTIVPSSSVMDMLESLPIKKMKQLGGKLGSSLQSELDVNTVGDLLHFSMEKLQARFGINTGTWLWNIARGVSGEEVKSRLLPLSHGSGKSFPGPQALKSISSVQKWLCQLSEELNERLLYDLEQNKRIARTLTLHGSAYKFDDSESLKKFPSKSCPLRYGIAKIQEDALNLFHAALREYIGLFNAMKKEHEHEWAINGLSLSASKIVVIPYGTNPIMKYFHNQTQSCPPVHISNEACSQLDTAFSSSGSCLPFTEIGTYEDGERSIPDIQSSDPGGGENDLCKMKQLKGGHQEEIISGSEAGSLSKQPPSKSVSLSKQPPSKSDFLGPALQSARLKRKSAAEKGSSSILRFFHNDSSCSFPLHESVASSSGKSLEDNHQTIIGPSLSTCTAAQQAERPIDDWMGYKNEEIDPSVLEELPLEIQTEVRNWLVSRKRANLLTTMKKGGSIVHYFSPTT